MRGVGFIKGVQLRQEAGDLIGVGGRYTLTKILFDYNNFDQNGLSCSPVRAEAFLESFESVFFLVVLKPEKKYFFRVCESREKVQTLKKQKMHGMFSEYSPNRSIYLALSKVKMVS